MVAPQLGKERRMTESQKQVAEVAKLFQIEKQYELSVYKEYLEARTPQERKKLGVCWFPVKLKEVGYGTASLPFAIVERNPGDRSPHEFSRGRPLTVIAEGENQQVFGHVLKVDDTTMVIALSGDDIPEWIEDASLSVNMVFDTKTFEEGEKAMSQVLNAEKGLVKNLREKLYGFEEIESGRQEHFSHSALNASQNAAVSAVLSGKEINVIYGPPGTGKTTTLVEGIVQLVKREKKILACAPSNAAVDHLTNKLLEAGVNVLRLGAMAKMDDDVLESSLDFRIQTHPQSKAILKIRKEIADLRSKAGAFKRNFGKEERENRKDLYREARQLAESAKDLESYVISSIIDTAEVITATLVGASHPLIKDVQFSMVVVDEAGQSLEPLCWIPLLRAPKFILAGDPHQLPPTVKSIKAHKGGLGITLLDKAIKLPGVASMLTVQYRMNKAIMAFSNETFYSGKLEADPSVADHSFDESPVEFIDTAGCGFEEEIGEVSLSRFNPGEANIIRKHLESLSFITDSAAIISPYREQVITLLDVFKDLPAIQINTIDSFQGQEKELVYISMVRSNDKGEIGFLSDYRRMNVAMTRARKKLVVVGDSATIGQDKFFAAFIDYCERSGFYRSAWEFMY